MAPATQPVPLKRPTPKPNQAANLSRLEPVVAAAVSGKDDGTSQLLKWGGWTLGTGLIFAILTKTVFGGIGPQGPHTNSGWMALIVTMMCLPFGFLLFLLGSLKWFRNRQERKRQRLADLP